MTMKHLDRLPCLALLLAPILIFLAPATLWAQGIGEKLQAAMDQNGAVGLAVAVVRDDRLIYTNSLGWKDLEAKVPLERDDIFRIASISKSFSATAIMQLLEAGKLSLDDEVGELVGFPVRNPHYPDVPITLKMFLNHTSSLTDDQGYFTLDVFNPDVNADWAKSYADRRPGEKYEYCNLAFNTIGAIIERLSGQRFDTYIVEHILEPLGLYGGYYVDRLDPERIAQIYYRDEDTGTFKRSNAYRPIGDRIENYDLGYSAPLFSPTGGMKISAPDLARYMTMHMNYGTLGDVRIIREENAKKMQRPLAWMDANRDYGFALHHDRGSMVPGAHLIGHTGDAYGLNSVMMFDPKENFGLVVITNGFNPSDPSFQSRIMSLLYDHFIAPAPRGKGSGRRAEIERFSLTLGGQGEGAAQGNAVDMKKREVLSLEAAFDRQRDIDLLYAHGESSGASLMLPSSEVLQYYGDPRLESVFFTWTHKNRGSLLSLVSSPENTKLFQKIKNNRQLIRAYHKALQSVDRRPGYRRWVHGPNASVYGLKVGDLVFLRVNSREHGILALTGSPGQEILALGQVKALEPGVDGAIEIDFKAFTRD